MILLAAACGGDADDSGRASEDPADGSGQTSEEPAEREGSLVASPFVAEVPDGFQLRSAGQGSTVPRWGGPDATGNTEPLTVLAPPGEGTDSPDAVFVSTTSLAGYERGLQGAVTAGVAPAGQDQEFELDGRRAIFTSGPDQQANTHLTRRNQVIVVSPDDDFVAVRVVAAEADRDELSDIARRVEVADDHTPVISDPPEGLEVVGSLDADAVFALVTALTISEEITESAYGVAYSGGSDVNGDGQGDEWVKVTSLPGRSGAAAVADAFDRWVQVPMTVDHRTVGDRPVAVLEYEQTGGGDDQAIPGGRAARLVLDAPWGDLVVISAYATEVALPDDQLLAIAASLREADTAEWDRLVAGANAGAG